MKVTTTTPNIKCYEYRQEHGDTDYGSCLYARFYFNLDRYELMIISDCGNYGYKWIETPDSESFMELMARCDGGYLIDKIYGSPDIFDYEATKAYWLKEYEDENLFEEEQEKLKEFFADIELYGSPTSAEEFANELAKFDDGAFGDDYDIWNTIEYVYPANAKKIAKVFESAIVPAIRKDLGIKQP